MIGVNKKDKGKAVKNNCWKARAGVYELSGISKEVQGEYEFA